MKDRIQLKAAGENQSGAGCTAQKRGWLSRGKDDYADHWTA